MGGLAERTVTTELSTALEQERLDAIGAVDLVIGLVDQDARESIAAIAGAVRQGLSGISTSGRTLLLHNHGGSAAGALGPMDAFEDTSLKLLAYSVPPLDPSIPLAQNMSNAYRTIWDASEKLGARACVVIGSSVETVTPQWFYALAQPILERDFDLVTPCYALHKFEALLNSAILYPLTRAVYGKQIQNPLGPDFGFGARLIQNLLQAGSAKAKGTATRQFVLIGPTAIVKGFKICQAHLGQRIHPPVDWKNLDSVLAGVLGPLFLDIERDAAFWQRIRSSVPVPTYGDLALVGQESTALDLRRLLEPFQLGFRNLQEIWALLLPPRALLELNKLHRLPREQFRIPDELWARIVYDFALAHRLRTIGRDHLLRAMTPMYLGWVASYVLEVETADAAAVQKRLERLCLAYESCKPYLVSRWRWPDRFNP
jgi:hypothetical protein